MGNGNSGCGSGWGSKFGKMEVSTKGTGRITKLTVMGA